MAPRSKPRIPPRPQPVRVRNQVGLGKVVTEEVWLGPLEDWTLDQIEYALQYTAATENAKVEAAGRELSEVIVDRSAGKLFNDAQRVIDMRYGGQEGGVRQVMRAVEVALRRAIKTTTNKRSGSLMDDWKWTSYGPSGNNIASSGVMQLGDVLVYSPIGKNRQYAAVVNSLVAKNNGKKARVEDLSTSEGGIKKPRYVPQITVRLSIGQNRSRRSRTKGFVSKAVNSIRNNRASRGFYVRVQFAGK